MQASTPSREITGVGASGFPPLVLMLASILLAPFIFSMAAEDFVVLMALPLLLILWLFLILGFYKLQPNEAGVLTLFGAYRGTDRGTGLRWTWLWIARKKVSCRAHNLISQQIKVNDQRGNPIEIAAQLVWRITDTAQATFDVDNYAEFVLAQVEVAVRTIGARYPYDDFEHKEVTLRGDHEQIAGELRTELIERLKVAGITVDECGFTHLAYAPEIAGSMLRRQQAAAVVAARETLVLGAVSMVEMALEQLSARDIIQLDGERRAAMVSNLMVILCGDREAQPVVNTGSLYQ